MPTRALVVLNPLAHGGRSARRFETVRPMIESAFQAEVIVGRPDGAWRSEVAEALGQGVHLFIAAGGDGTAHALLNALIDVPQRPPLDTIVLGAVGLGSSNDLHKPVHQRLAGTPVLLDHVNAAPRDVIRCTYVDAAGGHRVHVLVSASLGATATANARFSAPTPLARSLRRMSTTAAIAWAVARTLATWRNMPARVQIDHDAPAAVALTSLGILKTEWLSGRLRYGHAVEPASGDFDVALAHGLGRGRLLADILGLLRGHFDERQGHHRRRGHVVDVRLEREAPLEFDGEVVTAREVHFDMLPERIRLCA